MSLCQRLSPMEKIFNCVTNDELILKSYGILDKDELKELEMR